MKIVLVGDLIIESGWCVEELKNIAKKYDSEYEAIDWETENVEGLRVRNLKIEKQGPAAVEPPNTRRNSRNQHTWYTSAHKPDKKTRTVSENTPSPVLDAALTGGDTDRLWRTGRFGRRATVDMQPLVSATRNHANAPQPPRTRFAGSTWANPKSIKRERLCFFSRRLGTC